MKAIIVDDDEQIRSALRTVVEALGAEVVGEADNGRSAIERAKSLHPELILLDVSMPVMGGLDAARELRQIMPHVPIILISQYTDRAYAQEALKAGAGGYVIKRSAGKELAVAIQAVMSGETFISPALCGSNHP